MKIEIISIKPVMLAAILTLFCTTESIVLAAPLQSGSKVQDPIIWDKAETVVKQTQPALGEAQPTYQSQPAYGQPSVEAQHIYSEPISGDCGCEPTPVPVQTTDCGCRRAGCTGCKLNGSRSCKLFSCCPKKSECPGDTCTLELDKSKVSKTRFVTEQVPVCVPPIRLPWMKGCPPGKSKTRLVTKLKKEKYKAESCGYKWTLDKPEEAPEAPTPVQAPHSYEATPVYDSFLPPGTEQITPAETFTPEVVVPKVEAPKLNPPKTVTPKVPATPNIGVPKIPASNIAPPPPTTGGLPWRVNTPSS